MQSPNLDIEWSLIADDFESEWAGSGVKIWFNNMLGFSHNGSPPRYYLFLSLDVLNALLKMQVVSQDDDADEVDDPLCVRPFCSVVLPILEGRFT
jgi:hypothetical protein